MSYKLEQSIIPPPGTDTTVACDFEISETSSKLPAFFLHKTKCTPAYINFRGPGSGMWYRHHLSSFFTASACAWFCQLLLSHLLCFPESIYSPFLAVLYNVCDISGKADTVYAQEWFIWTCNFNLSKQTELEIRQL